MQVRAGLYASAVPDECTRLDQHADVRCCCDEDHYTCGLSHTVMDAVVEDCGSLPHDCMFLVSTMGFKEGERSCSKYCARQNLRCIGGWVSKVNASGLATCEPERALGCEEDSELRSKLICECDVNPAVTGVPVDLVGTTYGLNQSCENETAGGVHVSEEGEVGMYSEEGEHGEVSGETGEHTELVGEKAAEEG